MLHISATLRPLMEELALRVWDWEAGEPRIRISEEFAAWIARELPEPPAVRQKGESPRTTAAA